MKKSDSAHSTANRRKVSFEASLELHARTLTSGSSTLFIDDIRREKEIRDEWMRSATELGSTEENDNNSEVTPDAVRLEQNREQKQVTPSQPQANEQKPNDDNELVWRMSASEDDLDFESCNEEPIPASYCAPFALVDDEDGEETLHIAGAGNDTSQDIQGRANVTFAADTKITRTEEKTAKSEKIRNRRRTPAKKPAPASSSNESEEEDIEEKIDDALTITIRSSDQGLPKKPITSCLKTAKSDATLKSKNKVTIVAEPDKQRRHTLGGQYTAKITSMHESAQELVNGAVTSAVDYYLEHYDSDNADSQSNKSGQADEDDVTPTNVLVDELVRPGTYLNTVNAEEDKDSNDGNETATSADDPDSEDFVTNEEPTDSEDLGIIDDEGGSDAFEDAFEVPYQTKARQYDQSRPMSAMAKDEEYIEVSEAFILGAASSPPQKATSGKKKLKVKKKKKLERIDTADLMINTDQSGDSSGSELHLEIDHEKHAHAQRKMDDLESAYNEIDALFASINKIGKIKTEPVSEENKEEQSTENPVDATHDTAKNEVEKHKHDDEHSKGKSKATKKKHKVHSSHPEKEEKILPQTQPESAIVTEDHIKITQTHLEESAPPQRAAKAKAKTTKKKTKTKKGDGGKDSEGSSDSMPELVIDEEAHAEAQRKMERLESHYDEIAALFSSIDNIGKLKPQQASQPEEKQETEKPIGKECDVVTSAVVESKPDSKDEIRQEKKKIISKKLHSSKKIIKALHDTNKNISPPPQATSAPVDEEVIQSTEGNLQELIPPSRRSEKVKGHKKWKAKKHEDDEHSEGSSDSTSEIKVHQAAHAEAQRQMAILEANFDEIAALFETIDNIGKVPPQTKVKPDENTQAEKHATAEDVTAKSKIPESEHHAKHDTTKGKHDKAKTSSVRKSYKMASRAPSKLKDVKDDKHPVNEKVQRTTTTAAEATPPSISPPQTPADTAEEVTRTSKPRPQTTSAFVEGISRASTPSSTPETPVAFVEGARRPPRTKSMPARPVWVPYHHRTIHPFIKIPPPGTVYEPPIPFEKHPDPHKKRSVSKKAWVTTHHRKYPIVAIPPPDAQPEPPIPAPKKPDPHKKRAVGKRWLKAFSRGVFIDYDQAWKDEMVERERDKEERMLKRKNEKLRRLAKQALEQERKAQAEGKYRDSMSMEEEDEEEIQRESVTVEDVSVLVDSLRKSGKLTSAVGVKAAEELIRADKLQRAKLSRYAFEKDMAIKATVAETESSMPQKVMRPGYDRRTQPRHTVDMGVNENVLRQMPLADQKSLRSDSHSITSNVATVGSRMHPSTLTAASSYAPSTSEYASSQGQSSRPRLASFLNSSVAKEMAQLRKQVKAVKSYQKAFKGQRKPSTIPIHIISRAMVNDHFRNLSIDVPGMHTPEPMTEYQQKRKYTIDRHASVLHKLATHIKSYDDDSEDEYSDDDDDMYGGYMDGKSHELVQEFIQPVHATPPASTDVAEVMKKLRSEGSAPTAEELSKIETEKEEEKLNKEQLAAFRKLFARFDRTKSGGISAQELYFAIQDFLPGVVIPFNEVENLLDEFDIKGTGEIDFEEFLFALTNPSNYLKLLNDDDKEKLELEVQIFEETLRQKVKQPKSKRKKGYRDSSLVEKDRSLFFKMIKSAARKYSIKEIDQFYVNRIKRMNNHVIQHWSAGQRVAGISYEQMRKRFLSIKRELRRNRLTGSKEYKNSPYAQEPVMVVDELKKPRPSRTSRSSRGEGQEEAIRRRDTVDAGQPRYNSRDSTNQRMSSRLRFSRGSINFGQELYSSNPFSEEMQETAPGTEQVMRQSRDSIRQPRGSICQSRDSIRPSRDSIRPHAPLISEGDELQFRDDTSVHTDIIRRLQQLNEEEDEEIRRSFSAPPNDTKTKERPLRRVCSAKRDKKTRKNIVEWLTTPHVVPLPKFPVKQYPPTFNYADLIEIRRRSSLILEEYYNKLKKMAAKNSRFVFKQLQVHQMHPKLKNLFTQSYQAYAGENETFVVSPWIPNTTPAPWIPYPPLATSQPKQQAWT